MCGARSSSGAEPPRRPGREGFCDATCGGGGLQFDNSDPPLTNCVIAGNTAQCFGGELYCWSTVGTFVSSHILWKDLPQEITGGDGSLTAVYSLVQGIQRMFPGPP